MIIITDLSQTKGHEMVIKKRNEKPTPGDESTLIILIEVFLITKQMKINN